MQLLIVSSDLTKTSRLLSDFEKRSRFGKYFDFDEFDVPIFQSSWRDFKIPQETLLSASDL